MLQWDFTGRNSLKASLTKGQMNQPILPLSMTITLFIFAFINKIAFQ